MEDDKAKRLKTLSEMLNSGLPSLNFALKFAESTNLDSSRSPINKKRLAARFSPEIALSRPLPFSFVALLRTILLFVALLFREPCRQAVTSMPPVNQLPIATIAAPGKIFF
jgi:hypothetical protein